MARYIDIEKAEYPYMSMSMWGVNSKDCKIYNEGVKATEDMITALPTADVVEVKRGYWKEIVEKGNCFDHTYYICTNCGVVALDEDYEVHCHHCGAKMDGERK